MGEIDGAQVQEVLSKIATTTAEKLSSESGKRVTIALLAATPFDADAVRKVFREQPVTIQIGWENEEFGIFLFIGRSTFAKTMPLFSGREREWDITDEQSAAELEHVLKAALQGAAQAFVGATGVQARFGEPVVQIDDGPDGGILADFWMVPVNIGIEDEAAERVIALLAPVVMEAIVARQEDEEEAVPEAKDRITVSEGAFSSIKEMELGAGSGNNLDLLLDVELPIAVELGRVNMLMKDILDLGPGAVVELNKFSGEPVDLFVNNKKFAEGEVVVIDQNFGVRITALVGPNERISAAREGVK